MSRMRRRHHSPGTQEGGDGTSRVGGWYLLARTLRTVRTGDGMTELASNLECMVCGRWWITAVGGHSGVGTGSTLCPGCHVDCENCGTHLTAKQLKQRRNTRSETRPACSKSCGAVLAQVGGFTA